MRGSNSIRTRGLAFDIASQRLDGEKKVQEYWFRRNVRGPHPKFVTFDVVAMQVRLLRYYVYFKYKNPLVSTHAAAC